VDNEGLTMLGPVEYLGVLTLIPLYVQVLELYSVQTDGEVYVGEFPDYGDDKEWFGSSGGWGGGVRVDGSLPQVPHLTAFGSHLLIYKRSHNELWSVVQREIYLLGPDREDLPCTVKHLIGSHTELVQSTGNHSHLGPGLVPINMWGGDLSESILVCLSTLYTEVIHALVVLHGSKLYPNLVWDSLTKLIQHWLQLWGLLKPEWSLEGTGCMTESYPVQYE